MFLRGRLGGGGPCAPLHRRAPRQLLHAREGAGAHQKGCVGQHRATCRGGGCPARKLRGSRRRPRRRRKAPSLSSRRARPRRPPPMPQRVESRPPPLATASPSALLSKSAQRLEAGVGHTRDLRQAAPAPGQRHGSLPGHAPRAHFASALPRAHFAPAHFARSRSPVDASVLRFMITPFSPTLYPSYYYYT